MTQEKSVWSRIGHWMNPLARDETLPDLAKPDRMELAHGEPKVIDDPSPAQGGERIMPWRRRSATLEQLQHGYDKVLDVVDSMQRHLQLLNERSDRVTSLLSEVTREIGEVPKATRQQGEALVSLANQMELSNRHCQSIVTALSDLPTTARAQKQALDSIALQIEASASATVMLSERLDSLGRLVGTLDESSNEQVRTLQIIQQAAQQQDLRLVAMLDRQTRRLTVLFTAVFALAVAALGIRLFS